MRSRPSPSGVDAITLTQAACDRKLLPRIKAEVNALDGTEDDIDVVCQIVGFTKHTVS